MYKFVVLVLLSWVLCFSVIAEEHAEKPKSPLTPEQKQTLVLELLGAFGSELDPTDTEAVQVAEGFILSEASKAYAYTKLLAVPLEFCSEDDGSELITAKNNYTKIAEEWIRLGEYYYNHGFSFTLGGETMGQAGEELTAELENGVAEIRAELVGADKATIAAKCSESIEAYNSLVGLYGG